MRGSTAGALATGFGPFSRWTRNSSEAAARALEGAGCAVRVLPVDHLGAAEALADAFAQTRPRVALLMGLADRPEPTLELVARRPAHVASGPETLAGLWPWAAALDAMRATGCAPGLSRDPGRYVCETTYWSALALRAEAAARVETDAPACVAFLHLPPISERWPEARLAAAARACLDVCSA